MEPTSNVKSLSDRLKAKTEQQREDAENLIRSAQQQLVTSSNAQLSAALNTIERTIRDRAEAVKSQSVTAMDSAERAILERAASLSANTKTALDQTGAELRKQAESAGKSWFEATRKALQNSTLPAEDAATRTYSAAQTAQQNAEALAEALRQVEASAKLTRLALMRATLIPLIAAISVLAIICGSGWGILQYQWSRYQAQDAEIQEQIAVLKRLPRGVTYYEEQRLLLLPTGAKMKNCNDNQPCVVLEK